ncbi:MAG: class B sortase [Oscillospiraceae bacterium]|nr:class B sortase [Oscillospiraceae bacterium]
MDKSKKKHIQKKSGRLIFAALIAIFLTTGVIAVYNLISTQQSYSAAQNEYAELRQWAPAIASQSPAGSDSSSNNETQPSGTEQDSAAGQVHIPMPDLSLLNPDYIGWIRIDGTTIDYPILQGTDNVKYLTTTFMGERNPSGAIFMDSENDDGFKGLAILHGHNMRDGSMFAGLHNFRDDDFLASHSEIAVYLPDGEALLFNIFDVIISDIYDPVFDLPIEGQEAFTKYFGDYNLVGHYVRDRSGILVLSTCTDGNRNERLLILAVRV